VDAIQIIRRDHRELDQLFRTFERADRDGDEGRQGELARAIVRDLSLHAAIEEQFLYPALRRAGVEDERLDALEEHHAAKLTLAELDALHAGAPRFVAKVHVLIEGVRRHVEEEERSLLPRLERALDDDALNALGDTLARARALAPTRPHPAAPDEPPGVFFAGAIAAVYDRARDAMREAASFFRGLLSRAVEGVLDAARAASQQAQAQGREALEDLRVRGREALAEARETAESARARSQQALDGAGRRGREAARRTKATARVAAREARRGGRATAKTARGESRSTVH
jgi:hemerythrin-like domain-containing protein